MIHPHFVVMTTAKAKPGKEQIVRQALSDVAEAARAQLGCIDYQVFRSVEDNAVTVNFERWSTEEQRDAFLNGPEVKEFIAAVSGTFVEPPQPITYQEMQ